MSDPRLLAEEIAAAYDRRLLIDPPTARDGAFDLTQAYAVEAELARMRQQTGHRAVGWKVGYANKAVWRALKLETLVWARMYDHTVHVSTGGQASLSIARMIKPKIEPEIVLRFKQPLPAAADAAAVLAASEWIAIGFEIIDCAYPEWKFQAADFVAAYGLHAALVVGTPVAIDAATIPDLVERLPRFQIKLSKNGEVVAEGSGKNSLRSPALCVAELATAMAQRGAETLDAGAIVSTGTLTDSQFIAAGESWRVNVEGFDLPSLTLALD